MADRDAREPRKVGRPRLDDRDSSVPLSVRLPSKQYDHLATAARAARVTVAEVVRRKLARDDDR